MNWVHIWNSFTQKMTSCHHSANENRNLMTPSLRRLLSSCSHIQLSQHLHCQDHSDSWINLLPSSKLIIRNTFRLLEAAVWLGLHFTSSLGQVLTITMHRLQLSWCFYFTCSWVAALYGSRWKESFPWIIREQFCSVLLTLLFCTHQSRAQPSGTSSLGVEGLSSPAGLEEAKAAQGFQIQVVSQGPHVDWEVQLLSQRNWKKK